MAALAMGSRAPALAQDDPFSGLAGAGGSVPTVSVTVKKGDSLDRLAREYYYGHLGNPADGAAAIAKANGLSRSQPLKVGQELALPYPFEGQAGAIVVAGSTGLDSVAAQAYGYTDHPSLYWPLIDQATPELGPPGGHRVARGTHLNLPAVPIDGTARVKMLEGAYAREWDRFRSELASNHLSDAYRDRLLLREGFVPLMVKEDAAVYGKLASHETRRIDAVLDGYATLEMLGGLPRAAPMDGDLDAWTTKATDLIGKLATVAQALRAVGEGDLASTLEAARAKAVGDITSGMRAQIQALVPRVDGPAAPSLVGDAMWRPARLLAFKMNYAISRLAVGAGLTDLSRQLGPDLEAARRAIPPPAPVYPAEVQKAYHADPLGRTSMTVEHARFAHYWLPMAVAYAKGLWSRFPAARDARGALITVEDVFKAIVMHESRGVHEEGGRIVKNVNSPTSIDYGFAQINNMANGHLSLRLDTMAATMGAPWTAAKLAGKDYMDVPKSKADKSIVLDIMKPPHNLIAGVIVLSYGINKSYPNTATPEENLIKSLAGYNHGSDNPDLNKPWMDLVTSVDARGSDQAKISAVAYGIGMKLYLGMTLDAREVQWWSRLQGVSLDRLTQTYVDTFYAYAHFP